MIRDAWNEYHGHIKEAQNAGRILPKDKWMARQQGELARLVEALVVEQGGEAMTEQVLDSLCTVHKANSVNKAFKIMKAERIAKEKEKKRLQEEEERLAKERLENEMQ